MVNYCKIMCDKGPQRLYTELTERDEIIEVLRPVRQNYFDELVV